LNPLDIDKNLEKYFFILYRLAEMGARGRPIKVSTKFLAERVGASQQSVSRHLLDLERIGWIKRNVMRDGSLVRISASGEAHLRKVRSGLNMIFEKKYPPSIVIEGVVFSGIGEGAYYVTRKQYREQFIEKLGFDPYPGTLNLKITSEYNAKMRAELEAYPGIEIKGFKDEDRTYGPVKCFHAVINGKEKGAVVLALRSHYDSSVLEVVAPVGLRDRLKLKDGNKVRTEIFLTKP